MSSLFDDFGFVAVVVQGLGFVAQSVLIGATAFVVLVMPRGLSGHGVAILLRMALIVVNVAALATIVVALATALLTAGMLVATVASAGARRRERAVRAVRDGESGGRDRHCVVAVA